MKKALVFGAGGFAGGHLVNELVSNNYEVYGCSRYGKITDKRYAGAMVCDIMDVDRVKTVIAEVNPDYIINMAGISSVGLSWKIPQTTIDVNVVGPVNILETVKETNPDAHILLSGRRILRPDEDTAGQVGRDPCAHKPHGGDHTQYKGGAALRRIPGLDHDRGLVSDIGDPVPDRHQAFI